MNKQVLSYIERHNLIDKGDTVTVGLSGGADSVALLLILLDLREQLQITVRAAHLNHKIRGEEAERDQQFVEELCRKLSVECIVKCVDVVALSKAKKISLELAARNARYEFFETLDGKVATAHTAGDNIETIIYNLSRGTGIKGLCGIPTKRGKIIRPLLCCSREQTEECCASHAVAFVTDSTNLTDDYSRNRIRHSVVPTLCDINSAAVKNASRTGELLLMDNDFLSSEALKAYNRIKDLKYNTKAFLELHPAILSRVLKLMASDFGATPENRHIELMINAIKSLCGTVQLNNNAFFKVNKHTANFLTEPQAVSFDTRITYVSEKEKINNLLLKNAIDYDKISGELKLRNRLVGDKISLAHRNVTKSLKKLFNEAQIPEHLRDVWPVVADENGVLWVYKLGVDKRAVLSVNTQKAAVFDVLENI